MSEARVGSAEWWVEIAKSDEPLHPDLVPYVYNDAQLGKMLRHPLVYSIPLGPPALANVQYTYKVKAMAEAEAAGDWAKVIWLHERPYRLDALTELAHLMPDTEFWEQVGQVWTDSENIYQNSEEWEEVFASERPGREAMMEDDDRAALAAMPDPLTIFRGFNVAKGTRDGLSWTTDEAKATWFARRFAQLGEVVEGTIARADVVAYFSHRGESEIVVRDAGLVTITRSTQVMKEKE